MIGRYWYFIWIWALFWCISGWLRAEVAMNMSNGTFIFYYPNGKVCWKGVYQNDRRNGQYMTYYQDGTINWQAYFKNDRRHGLYVAYYPKKSRPKIMGYYKEGLRHGVYKAYYPNGHIRMQMKYKNGVRQGACKWYYEDGHIRLQGTYRNDEKVDKWVEYNRKGTVIKTKIFR